MSEQNQIQEDEGKPSVLPHLSHAALSDVGKRREENQDSYGVIERDELRAYIVADGMGGVKGGAIASQLAIKIFQEKLNGSISPEAYVAAVKQANAQVFKKGQEDQELAGMGTTFLALCFSGSDLHVVHVGDSRAYRFREDRIEQLTHDHTLIQELVDSGALSEDQAEDHPVSHMLTRSLGPTKDVSPDCIKMLDGPIKGDRFLICSDGLYNLVEKDEIFDLVSGLSDEEAAKRCVDEANARGGTDNITAVIITVGDEYPVELSDFPPSIQQASISEDTLELDRKDLEATIQRQKEKNAKDEDRAEASPQISGSVSLEEKLARDSQEFDPSELDEEPAEGIYSSPSNAGQVVDTAPRRNILPFIAGVAAALTVVGIVAYQQGIGTTSSDDKKELVKEVESSKEETRTVAAANTAIQETVRRPAVAEVPQTPPPTSTSASQVDDEQMPDFKELLAEIRKDKAGLQNGTTLIALQKRKFELDERAKRLNGHIELLEAPLSGSVGEMLRESPQQIRDKERELKSVRADIDIATRRLAVWYGRKRRMENSDPLSLSVEIGAISDKVGQAKKEFDEITWEYLKEAEAFQYNPDDEAQKRKLVSLRKNRQTKLASLSSTIEASIAEEIQASDGEISKLTLKRDRIEDELKFLEREQSIARVIATGTVGERKDLKEELATELRIVNAELVELESIPLPENPPEGEPAPESDSESEVPAEKEQ